MNNEDFQYWQNREKISANDSARSELNRVRAEIFDQEINGTSSESKLRHSEQLLVEAKMKAFGQIIRQSVFLKIMEKMNIDSNDPSIQKIYNERIEESIKRFEDFPNGHDARVWKDPTETPVYWKGSDELMEMEKDLIHHREETLRKNRKLVNNTKYKKK